MFFSPLRIIDIVTNVLVWLIIIEAVLSWIPDVKYRYRDITRWLYVITEPILKPIRRLVPPRSTGGLDISPILAIIALRVINGILHIIFRG